MNLIEFGRKDFNFSLAHMSRDGDSDGLNLFDIYTNVWVWGTIEP
jgi:hypothetical protein